MSALDKEVHLMQLKNLPPAGAVLGVDVGFSPKRASSAACRLEWNETRITWNIKRFRAVPEEQSATINSVAGNVRLLAAAFDGPLQASFEVIGRYRTAERMLTRRLRPKIGKPGQASAPVGKALNAAANDCAKLVIKSCQLAPATHECRINPQAVVEAFPSTFLGLMLDNPLSVAARRGDRSDVFFQHLTQSGTFQKLLEHFLADRGIEKSFISVTNHDDRAALVCAFTALAVAAGDYTAVGDDGGWIILPPRSFIQDWALADLQANAKEEKAGCWYTTASQSSITS